MGRACRMVNCSIGKSHEVNKWNKLNPNAIPGKLGYYCVHKMYAFPMPYTKSKDDTGKVKYILTGSTEDIDWAKQWIKACCDANFTIDDVRYLNKRDGVCEKHWNKEHVITNSGTLEIRVPWIYGKQGHTVMPKEKTQTKFPQIKMENKFL